MNQVSGGCPLCFGPYLHLLQPRYGAPGLCRSTALCCHSLHKWRRQQQDCKLLVRHQPSRRSPRTSVGATHTHFQLTHSSSCLQPGRGVCSPWEHPMLPTSSLSGRISSLPSPEPAPPSAAQEAGRVSSVLCGRSSDPNPAGETAGREPPTRATGRSLRPGCPARVCIVNISTEN